MGIYYSGGMAYGYLVEANEVPEQFDGDLWVFAETVAKTVGCNFSIPGNSYTGEHEAILFTAPGNYRSADSSSDLGITEVEPLAMTPPDVDKIVELYGTPKRECSTYKFISVF